MISPMSRYLKNSVRGTSLVVTKPKNASTMVGCNLKRDIAAPRYRAQTTKTIPLPFISHLSPMHRFFSSKDGSDDKSSNRQEANSKDFDKDETAQTFDFEGIDTFTRAEMEKRHKGIIMNEDGLSKFILPGHYVVKTNKKTGSKKMVAVERFLGYFWYLKDLKDTGSKPVMSNPNLIALEDAQIFPSLNESNDGSLETLSGESVSLPHFFISENRAKDPSAMCTLVTVAFNEFGNRMLPSWIEPFELSFKRDSSRVKTASLSINEGRTLRLLKYFISRSFQNSIPEEKKARTLLYFGSCPEFRDVLRMHNDKTGYVFLLDGTGKVRFAGSGEATSTDIQTLIDCVKELTPGLKVVRKETSSLKKQLPEKRFNR